MKSENQLILFSRNVSHPTLPKRINEQLLYPNIKIRNDGFRRVLVEYRVDRNTRKSNNSSTSAISYKTSHPMSV